MNLPTFTDLANTYSQQGRSFKIQLAGLLGGEKSLRYYDIVTLELIKEFLEDNIRDFEQRDRIHLMIDEIERIQAELEGE